MNKNIAQIAIIKPLHNLFDYEIPKNKGRLEPGSRVRIEFRKKILIGFVVKIKEQNSCSNYKLKKVLEVID